MVSNEIFLKLQFLADCVEIYNLSIASISIIFCKTYLHPSSYKIVMTFEDVMRVTSV
jgi:hypothetical protein